jgi:hypothetical protein
MSWLALLLGLALVAAGGGGLYASLDLRATDLGALYTTCGAIAISGGCIVIAIGLLIRRVDAVRRAVLRQTTVIAEATAPNLAPSPAGASETTTAFEEGRPNREASSEDEPSGLNAEPAATLLEESQAEAAPVNENLAGRPPPSDTFEEVAKEPAAPPTLVGRYSAGGANYSIFSDGSIEAETDQGAFKFGSMREFKSYIASRRS